MSGLTSQRLCTVVSVPERNAWVFLFAQTFMVVDQRTGEVKEHALEAPLAEYVDGACVNLTRDHVDDHWTCDA